MTKTDDGWVIQARVARGGNVQAYLGTELGVTDKSVVRIYRPENEVFDRKAFATYARKPITIGHPAEGVSPETWKDLAVGEIDRDVMRDGEFVSVPLLLRDAKAFAAISAADGPRELSMGYDATIEMKDGMTPAGEAYDAVMSNFRMNHVAIVPQARGGSELRIGDAAKPWGAAPITMSDQKEDVMSDALKTVVFGDKAAQVAVADAAIVEQFKADMAKKLTDAETAHTAAIDVKDEQIGTLKADLKTAQDAILTPAMKQKLVADRVALETTVKAISDKIVTDGVTDEALRKAAVVSVHGDEMVKDATDAEITGMFKAVAKDAAKGDPIAKVLTDGTPKTDDAGKARAAMIKDMQSAHIMKEDA